jgi:hypothetical protein
MLLRFRDGRAVWFGCRRSRFNEANEQNRLIPDQGHGIVDREGVRRQKAIAITSRRMLSRTLFG